MSDNPENLTHVGVGHWSFWAMASGAFLCLGAAAQWLPIGWLYVTLAAWGLGLLAFCFELKARGLRLEILFLVLFAAIGLVGLTTSQSQLMSWLASFEQFLDLVHFPLNASKTGHLLCFVLLTVYLVWLSPHMRFTRKYIVLIAICVAIGTEAIQILVSGRSSTLRDVWFDVAGIVFGLVAAAVIVPNQSRWLYSWKN